MIFDFFLYLHLNNTRKRFFMLVSLNIHVAYKVRVLYFIYSYHFRSTVFLYIHGFIFFIIHVRIWVTAKIMHNIISYLIFAFK